MRTIVRILYWLCYWLVAGPAKLALRVLPPPDHHNINLVRTRDCLHVNPWELIRVKVLHVCDGDTVMVMHRGERVCLRLDSIDCPEGDQEWGNRATTGLVKLIGGRHVHIETHGLDIYERTLATIHVEHHKKLINVNERMVMLGHAWVMRKYYKHLPHCRQQRLNDLEKWAISKTMGLWKSGTAIPPWEWRHKKSA